MGTCSVAGDIRLVLPLAWPHPQASLDVVLCSLRVSSMHHKIIFCNLCFHLPYLMQNVCLAKNSHYMHCLAVLYRRVRIISSWASALTSAQKRGWAYNTYFHAIGCSISPPTHTMSLRRVFKCWCSYNNNNSYNNTWNKERYGVGL